MSEDENDVSYCAVCGEPEFDEDGYETHDKSYDHDFEDEEIEDEGLTAQDLKDGLDILSKGFDVVKKYKDLTGKPNTPTNEKRLPSEPAPISDRIDKLNSSDARRKFKNEDKKGKLGRKALTITVAASIFAIVVGVITVYEFAEKRIEANHGISNMEGMSRVVPVLSYGSTSFCQKTIQFFSGEARFDFTYSNEGGADAGFTATVSSNEVLTKLRDSNQEFKNENQVSRYVDAEDEQIFNFILKINDLSNVPEEVSIGTSLKCENYAVAGNAIFDCGTVENICNYKNIHTTTFGPDYELIND